MKDQHMHPTGKDREEMQHEHAHHHPPGDHAKKTGQEHNMNAHGMEMHHQSPAHHEMMIKDFQKRFFIALALTIPIFILSPMIQEWFNFSIHIPNSQYLLLGLATVVFLYGGWPFLSGWIQEMKSKNPGMMTLIGFAITVAYLYSSATVFGLSGKDFYWELATLILIMLLGHWIEMRSILGASNDLQSLVSLMPSTAHIIRDGKEMDMPAAQLEKDQVIVIKPGEKIAADGIITDGNSNIDESMLTGESTPVARKLGDKVIAGSLNGNGVIQVKVSHTNADNYLSQVVKLVQGAQQAKSKTQLLADTAAKWLTIIALTSGLITFFAWWLSGAELSYAIERMVTVIITCCPHALGLAIPLVVARSTAIAAQNGLLIKNRTAFENARKINIMVFDKTGTITVGKFEVNRVQSIHPDYSHDDILSIAAALEQGSEHPIGQGIMEKVKELSLEVPNATGAHAITGKGISGQVNGKEITVGSPSFAKQFIAQLPANPDAGETLVFVIAGDRIIGYIGLSDSIRPTATGAIKTLREQHIKTVLLTGDNKAVAASVSKAVGIDKYIAEVLPHEKQKTIQKLQQTPAFVAMTGDGVNDAPALAQADIGIAVGSGSDVAAETADIILVNSDPEDIVNLVLFGKATYRKMIQNLAWATGYNIVTIPLAAGVLYKQGIIMSPAIGAVLMSISTIIVAINAGLLHLKKNPGQDSPPVKTSAK